MFCLSNGHSRANFASANSANVASTRASTRGRVCGAFRVDVVTRQAVLRGLARLAKGKFGECYANLASLANLGSVG